MMRSISILCITLLLGCANRGTSRPENEGNANAVDGGHDSLEDAKGTLVGDWFACEVPDCSEIIDDGTRFNPDGTWVSLDSPGGSPEPDGRYCVELKDEYGEYSWDGLTLTLIGGRENVTIEVDLRGDRATFYNMSMGSSEGSVMYQDIEALRVNSYTASSCSGGDDDLPPTGRPSP